MLDKQHSTLVGDLRSNHRIVLLIFGPVAHLDHPPQHVSVTSPVAERALLFASKLQSLKQHDYYKSSHA